MLDVLITAGAVVGAWLLTYALHSTLALGVVWGITRRRPLTPQARETLWRWAALAGLLTTAGQGLLNIPTPLRMELASLVAPAAAPSEPVVRPLAERPPVELSVPLVEPAKNAAPLAAVSPITPPPAPEPLIASVPDVTIAVAPPAPSPSLPWGVLGLLVAGGVGLVGAGWVLWQQVSFERFLCDSEPIDAGPARELLDDLCRQADVRRRVELLAGPDLVGPAACGLWRWRILLPLRALDDLSRDELQALLAHELGHLVRGDGAWLIIGRLLCGGLPFQPLNRLARREWQRASEFLCDDWAVRLTGERLALARCLTTVAGWQTSRRTPAVVLGALGRPATPLTDRVERLVEEESPDAAPAGRRRWRLAAAAGLGTLALLACGPRILATAGGPRGWARSVSRALHAPPHNHLSPADADLLDARLELLGLKLERLELMLSDDATPVTPEFLAQLHARRAEFEDLRAELRDESRVE